MHEPYADLSRRTSRRFRDTPSRFYRRNCYLSRAASAPDLQPADNLRKRTRLRCRQSCSRLGRQRSAIRSACGNGQAPAAGAAERLSCASPDRRSGTFAFGLRAGLEHAGMHSIGGFSPYQYIARALCFVAVREGREWGLV
jgi:hypothetical protein